jgi:hypothetical protein
LDGVGLLEAAVLQEQLQIGLLGGVQLFGEF